MANNQLLTEDEELAALEAAARIDGDDELAALEQQARIPLNNATISAHEPSFLDPVRQAFTGREVVAVPETDPATGRTSVVGYGEASGLAKTTANAMELGGSILGGVVGGVGGTVTGGPPGGFLGAASTAAVGNQLAKEAAVRMGLRPDTAAPRSAGQIADAASKDFLVNLIAPPMVAKGADMVEGAAGRVARSADMKAAQLGAFLSKKRQTVRMLTDNPMDAYRTGSDTIYNSFEAVKDDIMQGVPVEPQGVALSGGTLAERAGEARHFPIMDRNIKAAANTKWGPIVGEVVAQADGTIGVSELGLDDWFKGESNAAISAESNRALSSVYSSIKKMVGQKVLPPEDFVVYGQALDAAESAKDLLAKNKISPGTVSDRALISAYDAIDTVGKYDQAISQAQLSAAQLQEMKEAIGAMSRFDSSQISDLAEASKPGFYRDVYGRTKEALGTAVGRSTSPSFSVRGQTLLREQALPIFKEANEKYSALKILEPLVEKRAELEKFQGPYFESAPFGATERLPASSLSWYKKLPFLSAPLSGEARDALPMGNMPTARLQYVGGGVNYPWLRASQGMQQMGANMAVSMRNTARSIGELARSPVGPMVSQILTGGGLNELLPKDASAAYMPDEVSMAYARELSKIAPKEMVIAEAANLRAILSSPNLSPADANEILKGLSQQYPGMFKQDIPERYASIWDGKFQDPREAALHTRKALASGSVETEARVLEKTLAGDYEPLVKVQPQPDEESPLPVEQGLPTIDMDYLDGSFQSAQAPMTPMGRSPVPSGDDLISKLKSLSAGTDKVAY